MSGRLGFGIRVQDGIDIHVFFFYRRLRDFYVDEEGTKVRTTALIDPSQSSQCSLIAVVG